MKFLLFEKKKIFFKKYFFLLTRNEPSYDKVTKITNLIYLVDFEKKSVYDL